MAFLKRVFEVLQKDSYPTVCSFSENGESIIVHSIAEAEKSFLADVFNHSNYNSFVRQLNVYGFRKKRNSSMIEFSHPNFKRDRPDLIAYMARKGGKRKHSEITGDDVYVRTHPHQLGGLLGAPTPGGEETQLMYEMEMCRARLARTEEALFRTHAQAHEYISQLNHGMRTNASLVTSINELRGLLAGFPGGGQHVTQHVSQQGHF
mmetsp:Transcript_11916/g.27936  ORF Transcript_11916/g.27936 Transcript_11916/m.27936 type:complete len:206 (-) Transcript_11916:340-957(-)|eukprot:CAMPEP_0172615202 /NCGR_PEP_ID=MMETSP1068-20121228/56538_1 /TAXON_ID=35684 /ORGANISM="Pseudopedinella elastica, Strain CCMP716" /LENGTH=205 /DNA_ID=CAMNT_0013420269 /DNA_START=75 /DNA_END=692 /DNA_ORIENTATION=-